MAKKNSSKTKKEFLEKEEWDNACDLEAVSQLIEETALWASDIYRKIHMYPEIGNEEYRTASLIEACLSEIGLKSRRPLATSVVAEQCENIITGNETLTSENDGAQQPAVRKRRRIVFRAELDAIKIQEETALLHRSCRDGYMHACGHDVHMAVLLGAAKVFSKIKDLIDIDIKYIFQQDEEGDGKAKVLAELGEVKETDLVMGMHVRPSLPAGSIGIKRGMIHGASLMFDICLSGKKSHGAMPQLGCDALAASAAVVSSAYAMSLRCISPAQASLLSFGTICGGRQRNVIADEVRLSGIIRGESREMCSRIGEELCCIAESTAAAYHCQAAVELTKGYPPLVNDAEMTELVRRAAECCRDSVELVEISEVSLTVDDFAYYLEKGRGAYFYLGSGFRGRENSDIHTGTFCIDETCIKTGIQMLVSVVLLLCSQIEK